MKTEEIIAKAGRIYDKVTQDLDYPITGKMGRLDLIAISRREIHDQVLNSKEDRSDMIGELCSWDTRLKMVEVELKQAAKYSL